MKFVPFNRRSLTAKIFIPVLFAITIAVVALFLFLQTLLDDFNQSTVRNDLENMASSLYRIGDLSLNQLLHQGRSGNEVAIRITKAKTREMMDDLVRGNHLYWVLFDNNKEVIRSIELTDVRSFSKFLYLGENQLAGWNYNNKKYFLYHFQFDPWNWNILLIKETIAYSFLIAKFRDAFLFIAILFALGTFLLLYYLRKNIKMPVFEIISSLRQNKPPNYKGVLEFEFLSNHTAKMMRALQEKTRQAQAANLLKNQFLANMSHEIRTPMNAIIGLTELTLETELTETQRDYLEKVRQANQGLLMIIDDILDISKIEAGILTIHSRDFEIQEVLDVVNALFAATLKNKGVAFHITVDEQIPTVLNGDSIRLRQVLINLIGNAVKFTKEGSISVTITREKMDTKGVHLVFTVKDTGTGIPEDKLLSLFNSFTQVDSSTTRQYGGSGLGLSISKQLVELMHGRIAVKSEIGKGSTFSFFIQFEEGKNKDTKQSDTSSSNTTIPGARILLVEDNLINQQIALSWLEKMEMNVEIANNGKEALEILDKNSFDAVLMDIQMPEMDGYQATEKIRSELRLPDLPIIAMTAHTMPEEIEKCLATGMNDHISKPINSERLFSVLFKHVTIHK